jgi:hypothetical protein
MTSFLDGTHLPVDQPVCASCGQSRDLMDSVSANHAIAAVGVHCEPCDAMTVLRYAVDPFVVHDVVPEEDLSGPVTRPLSQWN